MQIGDAERMWAGSGCVTGGCMDAEAAAAVAACSEWVVWVAEQEQQRRF